MEAKKTSGEENDSSLSVVEFLREVEEHLKEAHLPVGKGKFIYTSLLGTAEHLNTSQNIKATFLIMILDPHPNLEPAPVPQPVDNKKIRWQSSWSKRTSESGGRDSSKASSPQMQTGKAVKASKYRESIMEVIITMSFRPNVKYSGRYSESNI